MAVETVCVYVHAYICGKQKIIKSKNWLPAVQNIEEIVVYLLMRNCDEGKVANAFLTHKLLNL